MTTSKGVNKTDAGEGERRRRSLGFDSMATTGGVDFFVADRGLMAFNGG